LQNVRKIKTVSLAIAAVSWTVSPLISFLLAPSNLILILLSSTFAVVAIAVWLICHNLEQKFLYGQETPLRNLS